ncbi:response regulator transcription factor [Paucibacter sp. APW11]|uniref:Response regulator transcription factor n=1 Tax=Roseateles aquae TaxID=3077235 RepID=A0ABU3PGI9_9BURK|nr:response regulator transcription factor [Paucibacter sp. APW11]MDT9001661.1 response regulator transcription factor [Paucibacter sp. APW11]
MSHTVAAPIKIPADKVIRLLLIDDHPAVRDGVRMKLEADHRFRVVAEAANTEDALELAAQTAVDVVLTDISMRGASGIELIRQLRCEQPQLRYVVFTMHDSDDCIHAATQAGANAYVLKGAPSREILAAVEAVSAGGSYFSAEIGLRLLRSAKGSKLTPREQQVLALIALGKSSKAIARELRVDARTIDTHRSSIKRKFELDSSAALVRFAVEGHWKSA